MTIQLADYRGVYTSAWVGTMVAMVSTAFISLVGFYIVKNAVDRDRRTGVGQILAATPLSKTQYMFGKALSNFAVLNSMVLILAFGALATQFFAAEDKQYDFIALVLPSILIAMPMMALTAAVAVLFENVADSARWHGKRPVVFYVLFCPWVAGGDWKALARSHRDYNGQRQHDGSGTRGYSRLYKWVSIDDFERPRTGRAVAALAWCALDRRAIVVTFGLADRRVCHCAAGRALF